MMTLGKFSGFKTAVFSKRIIANTVNRARKTKGKVITQRGRPSKHSLTTGATRYHHPDPAAKEVFSNIIPHGRQRKRKRHSLSEAVASGERN